MRLPGLPGTAKGLKIGYELGVMITSENRKSVMRKPLALALVTFSIGLPLFPCNAPEAGKHMAGTLLGKAESSDHEMVILIALAVVAVGVITFLRWRKSK